MLEAVERYQIRTLLRGEKKKLRGRYSWQQNSKSSRRRCSEWRSWSLGRTSGKPWRPYIPRGEAWTRLRLVEEEGSDVAVTIVDRSEEEAIPISRPLLQSPPSFRMCAPLFVSNVAGMGCELTELNREANFGVDVWNAVYPWRCGLVINVVHSFHLGPTCPFRQSPS